MKKYPHTYNACIINDYNIKPDISKIECEGCEFEIIPKYDYVRVIIKTIQ